MCTTADFVYINYRDLRNLGDQLDAAVHGAHEETEASPLVIIDNTVLFY